MIVLDASVAAKWLLPEEGREKAHGLIRSGRPLLAPSHIRLEVLGAVVRSYREGRLPEPRVRQSFDWWERIIAEGLLELMPIESLMAAALDLAVRLRHPLSDCLYVAAAQARNAAILTADVVLAERAAKVHAEVSLFGDKPPSDTPKKRK